MYDWKIDLSADRVKEEMKKYMQKNGMYYKHSLNQIIIRKPYYLFHILPVNFQPSLLLKYKRISESVTELTGKFGIPRFFYVLYYTIFFLTFTIFRFASHCKQPLLFDGIFILMSLFIPYILKIFSITVFKKACFDAKISVDDFVNSHREKQ